jgi:AAA15 family ATPase/GTPase
MIHRVKIQNFKNILNQTIDLDRLTVFVGANGSGKTSVLQAIELAADAMNDEEWDEHTRAGLRANLWLVARRKTELFRLPLVPLRGRSRTNRSKNLVLATGRSGVRQITIRNSIIYRNWSRLCFTFD